MQRSRASTWAFRANRRKRSRRRSTGRSFVSSAASAESRSTEGRCSPCWCPRPRIARSSSTSTATMPLWSRQGAPCGFSSKAGRRCSFPGGLRSRSGRLAGGWRLSTPADDGRGDFRIVVVPDPEDGPWPAASYLRQGVLAKGWVLLNRVSLGFEVWRQFNGFPPTTDSTAHGDERQGGPMSLAERLGVFVLGSLTPMLALASEERGRPLHFDEVLQSVNAHDPRIRQAVARLRKAESKTTRGARCV